MTINTKDTSIFEIRIYEQQIKWIIISIGKGQIANILNMDIRISKWDESFVPGISRTYVLHFDLAVFNIILGSWSLTSILNSQDLMSDGPGAGQWDEG